jgi:hypothetical protein
MKRKMKNWKNDRLRMFSYETDLVSEHRFKQCLWDAMIKIARSHPEDPTKSKVVADGLSYLEKNGKITDLWLR